ncbi:MAG: lipoyl(octanoyl) transferase LipB [Burkholderiaceae bacterium]
MIVRMLGRADYLPTWDAMRTFTAQRAADTEDELWLVEHPPVFTLGQAGRREHLLAETDIPVITTDRGGQITYHGPGQVVAYPLLDLRRLGIFVKELVFRIEQAAIQTLEAFGIDARRVRGAPGVYVPFAASRAGDEFAGLAKIAALGIKVTNGRSYHGLAMNVSMDLTPFSLINPCGYANLPAVDMATLDIHVGWQDAASRLAERLQKHLS